MIIGNRDQGGAVPAGRGGMAQEQQTKRDAIGADQPASANPSVADGGQPATTTLPPPVPMSPPPLPPGARRKEGSPASAEIPASTPPQSVQPAAVTTSPADKPHAASPSTPAGAAASNDEQAPSRRIARRRPAGPARTRVAANDDVPSIGGLIYALEQKPSNKPFRFAAIASTVWLVLGAGFTWVMIGTELSQGATIASVLSKPATFLFIGAVVVPIAVLWFLATLAWRAEELRLRSSAMTEVAIRLAEPDRMAEQSIASLGQSVRRQIAFMNDAVSRTLGRAGELEALVHNEVAALERSYEDNERKIRGLIQELSGERHALLNTSDRVADTLRTLGSEVPAIIDRLANQQVKLAHIIDSAGENLTSLETSLNGSVGRLENSLSDRTEHLQTVLTGYTAALDTALEGRTGEMQTMLEAHTGGMTTMLEGYTGALAVALGNRSDGLQAVFEEYARAIDTTLENRGQALQTSLAEHARTLDDNLADRTRALDNAFRDRLQLLDDQIMRSTMAIDQSVSERTRALTSALESHARTFGETITKQAGDLDEQLMSGISAVRRTSENITRQSLKAIEGLSGQSELLKNVTENLLSQVNGIVNRFENQGQGILRAANALETANHKIDVTLQTRHSELSHTLDRLAGKADEFGKVLSGYSSSIEGTLSQAEHRTRAITEELKAGTDAQSQRALEDLRSRFSHISDEVASQLGSITSRLDETSAEVRQRASRAAAEIAEEQNRLRSQLESLPMATRESADVMRRALQDQLKALEQLSSLTTRNAASRDVTPPTRPSGAPGGARPTGSLAQSFAQEMSSRPNPMGPAPLSSNLPVPAGVAAPVAGDGRDNWSFGDLLARASREEEHAPGGQRPPVTPMPAPPPHNLPAPARHPFTFNVDLMAGALDPATASAIWARLRAGQRGIMVRSIYTNDGRLAFDEVSRRASSDPQLMATINRYLSDFERILRDVEAKDPTGRLTQSHLTSETGRVYLFLSHAIGRLS